MFLPFPGKLGHLKSIQGTDMVRVGMEEAAALDFFSGWHLGDAEDVTFSSLMGKGARYKWRTGFY